MRLAALFVVLAATAAHAEDAVATRWWPAPFDERWPGPPPSATSTVPKVPDSSPVAAPEHPAPVIVHKQKPVMISTHPRAAKPAPASPGFALPFWGEDAPAPPLVRFLQGR